MSPRRDRFSVHLNGKKMKVNEGQSKQNSFEEKKEPEETGMEKEKEGVEEESREPKIIDFSSKQEEYKTKQGPYWDDGNRTWSPGLPFSRKKKKNESPPGNDQKLWLGRWIALVMGAVSLGLLFGFIFLYWLNDATEETEPASLAFDQDTLSEETAASDSTWSFNVKQAGAFETEAKANEHLEQLEAEGVYGTVVPTEDHLLLLLTMLPEESESELLSLEEFPETFEKTETFTLSIDEESTHIKQFLSEALEYSINTNSEELEGKAETLVDSFEEAAREAETYELNDEIIESLEKVKAGWEKEGNEKKRHQLAMEALVTLIE
ncbi:hypothetical protein [Salsuginibacillus kocurii]|uniref:hypothetical protein n=1 Tax=Salsuginibacillus kocurii TaxID=427078 RepID=UPI0003608782|nr:hypothetical protein [Salsuginibacillus kocurii]